MSRFLFIIKAIEKTWGHNVSILQTNVEAVVLYNQNPSGFDSLTLQT